MHDAARGMNVHLSSTDTQQRLRPDPRRGRSIRAAIRAVFNLFAIAAAMAVLIAAASAQQLRTDTTPFRGSTDLVTVGVTVAAKQHQFVTDLTASDFAVYEDGKLQQIFAFASGATVGPPLHVGVLLDVSGSQLADLEFTQNAVIKFLKALPDAADVAFIDFATEVRGGHYTPSDFPRLFKRVRDLRASGETALFDAIGMYLDGAAGQDGRKVMVLYTDGADTASSLSLRTLMRMLKASDVTVYTIGALDNQPQSTQTMLRALLGDIAASTGGAAFFPSSAKQLTKIYDQVLGEVRAQYTIGYVSTNEVADGGWRKVDVRITRADARRLDVRARKGYYAPSAH